MGLFRSLASVLGVIGRMLGLVKADAEASVSPSKAEPFAAVVPAVAGFVWRLTVDRFMLARRLASIARLNTPVGRKPCGSMKRSVGLPPIPIARLGAKKTRLGAHSGMRVMRPPPSLAASSPNVVPFPVKRACSAARATSLPKAA